MINNYFITAEEVAEVLGIAKGTAYRIIKQWNEELKAKGFHAQSGRISRKYFEEKLYGYEDGGEKSASI